MINENTILLKEDDTVIGSILITNHGNDNYLEIGLNNTMVTYKLKPNEVATLKRSIRGLTDYLG